MPLIGTDLDDLTAQVCMSVMERVEEVELPDHQTFLFRRPRVMLPDDCPCVVVWLEDKVKDKVENMRAYYACLLGVSWHEETVESARTLVEDDEISIQLLSVAGKIERRLRQVEFFETLTLNGMTLFNAWELQVGRTQYFRDETGLTEGYRLEVGVSTVEDVEPRA